jgi:hypothetical protein
MRSYKSHAVDLDQVNARLLEINASPTPPKQPQETPRTPDCDEEEDTYSITEETAACQELVADGGRPWYPFHLFEHVRKHPTEHHSMLRFWCFEGDWVVYRKQWERWKSFRHWQDDNRGLLNVHADFEKQKAGDLSYYERHGGDTSNLMTERRWANDFESLRNRRGWQHRYTVEHGLSRTKDEDRFRAYVLAVRARLDRHGFARPVQLGPDPKNQDILTTWIEYLNYEYWVHDGFADKATRLQSQQKQVLNAIVEAGVLRHGETIETIARFHHGLSYGLEDGKEFAAEAVKAAELAVSAAQQALDGSQQASHRRRQETELARAKVRWEKAVETAKSVKKRAELISKYSLLESPQSEAIRLVEKHKILLQWILDQVPLIEAEMAEGKVNASSNKERASESSDELDTKTHEANAQTDQDIRPEPETEPPAQPCALSTRKRAQSDDNPEDTEGPALKRRKLEAEVHREVALESETLAKSSQRI